MSLSSQHTADSIVTEEQTLVFRGEEFTIVYNYCIDSDTGESYTTPELDELNITQVHNQYRSKYGIPFINEIKAIREKYGLSASKMSDLLGFGTNGFKNYENGEVPSIPHGRYLQLVQDPQEFLKIIALNKNELTNEELEKIVRKVNSSLQSVDAQDKLEEHFIFGDTHPNEYNGYCKPLVSKIGLLVAYFSEAVQPFTTKMNKLLFYSDFLHYRLKGCSISGLNYIAITHGPVPKRYGTLYSTLFEKGYFDYRLVDFGNGVQGEQFVPKSSPDMDLFTHIEMDVIKEVVSTFGKETTKDVVSASHEEFAWTNNVKDRAMISYQYGFALKKV